MARPFTVEVALEVSAERAWRALTDTSETARWFGWDAETLAEEIRFIFVDHCTFDEQRLRMESTGMDQYVEIVPAGPHSLIRAVQAGDESEHGGYDSMKSGWIQFFHQMKQYLEDHPGEMRRTVFLRGQTEASGIASVLRRRLAGEIAFMDEFTLVLAPVGDRPGLAVLNAAPGLEADRRGEANLTLTAWGLDEAEFSSFADAWFEWWAGLVESPELVIGRA